MHGLMDIYRINERAAERSIALRQEAERLELSMSRAKSPVMDELAASINSPFPAAIPDPHAPKGPMEAMFPTIEVGDKGFTQCFAADIVILANGMGQDGEAIRYRKTLLFATARDRDTFMKEARIAGFISDGFMLYPETIMTAEYALNYANRLHG